MHLHIAVSGGGREPRVIAVELFPDGFRLLETEAIMIDATPNAVSFNSGQLYETAVSISGRRWKGERIPRKGERVSLRNETQNKTYQIGTIASPPA